ncbi:MULTISPECIES: TIGR04076 family protein [Aerococcus]|uniref:TIGR04076 family protein n=1 Tax=Aerococcus mictus TaxID=2976810 RepID=A0A1E9PFS4_9LACT|nr:MULTISPECIES: TIGR04076 family protein [Aerococcus]KAA9234709.1 TIGR04076 family protein [Aerococcus mictus]KAA9292186.1 TIGR04076 family protein [Aerococcus mictus]MBU5609497.1 TIGR04076 family protein [Aerococcus urinae]MCY3033516.1 TIGR04076 family protein [Aerococcus mictus]MCY3064333.1 TIGR04076 family protein [Aerococcus mictus]
MTDDLFTLYTLKVEVLATDRPFVCSHREGDYFIVEGENLIFSQTRSFSMYALATLLPVLPAKQRLLQENDWMRSDAIIACPDPNCGAVFKITRKKQKQFSHAETTVVPLNQGDDDQC